MWRPDPMLDLAVENFIDSIHSLGTSSDARELALASDLVYESNYCLDWWQKLFFPVLSQRLKYLQRHFRAVGLGDPELQTNLRKTVAQLEFGDKAPPPYVIQLVRQNVLANQLTNWQVRQAFNSRALKKCKDGLRVKMQPRLLNMMAFAAQWVFGIGGGLLFLDALLSKAFSAQQIYMAHSTWLSLTVSCILGTSFFFQLGRQWQRGGDVMQKIWPTDPVSPYPQG